MRTLNIPTHIHKYTSTFFEIYTLLNICRKYERVDPFQNVRERNDEKRIRQTWKHARTPCIVVVVVAVDVVIVVIQNHTRQESSSSLAFGLAKRENAREHGCKTVYTFGYFELVETHHETRTQNSPLVLRVCNTAMYVSVCVCSMSVSCSFRLNVYTFSRIKKYMYADICWANTIVQRKKKTYSAIFHTIERMFVKPNIDVLHRKQKNTAIQKNAQ